MEGCCVRTAYRTPRVISPTGCCPTNMWLTHQFFLLHSKNSRMRTMQAARTPYNSNPHQVVTKRTLPGTIFPTPREAFAALRSLAVIHMDGIYPVALTAISRVASNARALSGDTLRMREVTAGEQPQRSAKTKRHVSLVHRTDSRARTASAERAIYPEGTAPVLFGPAAGAVCFCAGIALGVGSCSCSVR